MALTAKQARALVAFSNVTPVWLLIFLRLVKQHTGGDYAKAWTMLPSHLPQDMKPPTIEEMAAVLAYHHLA